MHPTSVVELLQALIRIPSVNPTGDPGTPHTGEQRIAEWLADWIRAQFPEARVELRDVLPGRPNVVARFSDGSVEKPRVLLAPHTDTVSVGGMTVDPFGAEIRDGCIWGRGSSDTKGTMAAMLCGLLKIRDRLPHLGHEIWFAGLCSEEAGQHGAIALSREERFDLVIAGEPTGLDAVLAHKGALWLNLTTRGRAVHAAQPERGENAIYKMSDVLRCVRDVVVPDLAALGTNPLLGHTTASAGTITGGSKINIVPDVCRAEVDIRYLPGQDLVGRVSAQLRAACPDLEVEHTLSLPMLTDEAHPLIAVLKSCGSRCIGAPWFSDAGIFSQQGMPSIALGCGSIAQAHTRDEFLAIKDLEEGADFFARFLAKI